MNYLLQKSILGLIEIAILWLAYVIFIKYIIQNKQNKQWKSSFSACL